ncbi:hypothetical protein PsorP6_016099 [Peronosclerospora sorghi]|uniref:Uncharacterized protein n=1 Tax=Peronosclerospora sorghi TaxID=230839 RepID=A0ACC0WME9_9STRA|nr:hypothetical protein PsorP6_016099 [Peronosclerospora sorghi]
MRELEYKFLQIFSVYLAQCNLQAVILTRHNDIQTKFDNVVKDIHLSWATLLMEHIKQRIS